MKKKILSIYQQKSTRSRTSSINESSSLFTLADILRFIDNFPNLQTLRACLHEVGVPPK